MLFVTALSVLWEVSSIYAVSITASDLPECAVECYCATGEKVKIPVTDYEGQCRSVPFQISLRECAEKACNEEEYAFVNQCTKSTECRPNTTQKNTVLNLGSIRTRFFSNINSSNNLPQRRSRLRV